MYYQFYEMNHAAVSPLRAAADATRLYFRHPLNPLTGTALGRGMAAAAELFERVTRRCGKPDWDLHHTQIGGRRVPVTPIVVWSSPFCRLIHFRKTAWPAGQPRVLIVAPMSGHYATLLRGTVESLLPDHDVYITDWVDARMVPLADGIFDLDNYIDYVIEIFRKIGPGSHVIAVCQPSVPVLAAVALMSARGEAGPALDHDADGWTYRHQGQSDRGQQTCRKARSRLVPGKRGHAGTVPPSRFHAQCLPWLPGSFRAS